MTMKETEKRLVKLKKLYLSVYGTNTDTYIIENYFTTLPSELSPSRLKTKVDLAWVSDLINAIGVYTRAGASLASVKYQWKGALQGCEHLYQMLLKKR